MGLFRKKNKSGASSPIPNSTPTASDNDSVRYSTAPPSYRSRYSNEYDDTEATSYRNYDYSTDPNTYDGNFVPQAPSYNARNSTAQAVYPSSSPYAEKGEPTLYGGSTPRSSSRLSTPEPTSYGASPPSTEPTSYGASMYRDSRPISSSNNPSDPPNNPYNPQNSGRIPSPPAPAPQRTNINPYASSTNASASRSSLQYGASYSGPSGSNSNTPQNGNPLIYAGDASSYTSPHGAYSTSTSNHYDYSSQEVNYEPATYEAAKLQSEMEEEDPDKLKQSIRYTKMESLNSTERALQAAARAEMAGMNTLASLAGQEEKLLSAQANIKLANAHGQYASYQAKDLKIANRPLFLPNINLSKGKQRAQEERERLLVQRNWNDRVQPERAQIAQRQQQKAVSLGLAPLGVRPPSSRPPEANKGKKWGMYQFEADEEDDAIEQGIDDNLNQLAAATSNLKMLATTIGEQVDHQNKLIHTMNGQVNEVDDGLVRAGHRLKPYGY
ncbi:hypothetical protein AA313_de0203109 [Arthrobotrys entomopaga]|nr:hypothetical protein AA313_de0203109 [Arthrobotrys entomopaga]